MTQQYRVAIGGVAEIGIATPHYFSICILTKPVNAIKIQNRGGVYG